FFFYPAEPGLRDFHVTGVQTCALPIYPRASVKFHFTNSRFGIKICCVYFLFCIINQVTSIPTSQRVCHCSEINISEIIPVFSSRSEERRVGKERRYDCSQHILII